MDSAVSTPNLTTLNPPPSPTSTIPLRLSSPPEWLPEEVSYLKCLSKTSEELSVKLKRTYSRYKKYQARFRIPAIIVSALAGLFSFGNANFPQQYQSLVSVVTGCCSVAIAVLNSIETYMKIGETMSSCMVAAMAFHRLKERIDCELSLPIADRSVDGLRFVRECAQTYERIYQTAPSLLRSQWFVRPIIITDHPSPPAPQQVAARGSTALTAVTVNEGTPVSV
jgi:hypothetical protein